MDLLASFHLDSLPEQQTRTLDLIARYADDFHANLGFDACCTCGVELRNERVSCPSCRRVQYCSESCRVQDANATAAAVVSVEGEEEQENALGHTAVICALLKLCDDDEAVENGKADTLDEERRQSAQDRVQSEFESYQATLANTIAEAPCFQDALRNAATRKCLVVHVIGASTDSEFWDQTADYASAYAEALAELSETRCLDTIKVYFFGPECPAKDVDETRPMRNGDHVAGTLILRSFRGLYSKETLQTHQVPAPDAVAFFNPGFTVPEYDWRQTLADIPRGTPFLTTTNTELEGIADSQFLLDQDMIQSIPPGLADIFGLYSAPDEDDEEPASSTAYFGVNPFSGLRVRQSGTMANDLYVKNRWMLSGIMDSFNATKPEGKNKATKKMRSHEDANTKSGNPALV